VILAREKVMTRGCFVTGTDTDIGKTLVVCALLHACRRRGLAAVGMKPVAAGTVMRDGLAVNDDVEGILAASSMRVDRELANPYVFSQPIAPHIAAADEKASIDPDHILACYRQLAAQSDVVIVEGVGGFRVPLGDGIDTAGLAGRLGLPVILVVGLRLGCINHALLTAEAIRARGLVVMGWVANQIDPAMRRVEENIAALDARLEAPRLGYLEYLSPPDPRTAAARLTLPRELVE